MQFDYVVVTKNDVKTIERAIKSIRAQTNVNNLIVVLSEKSNDGTRAIISDLIQDGIVDIAFTESVGLAYARKLGGDIVSTEWFAFVDGDVFLCENWAESMTSYITEKSFSDVGGFCGMLYRNKHHLSYLQGKQIRDVDRLYTHNTLINSKLIKTWYPDQKVNAWEDYLLTKHIQKEGYRCVTVPVFSEHCHMGSTFKSAAWNGAGAKYLGVPLSKKKLFWDKIWGGLKSSWKFKSLWFLSYGIKQLFGILWGRLRWKKYLGIDVR